MGLILKPMAYDLTPDRGEMAYGLSQNGSYSFKVFNVGKDDWGPVNNCGTNWSKAQWRGETGKRIGNVVAKAVIEQYDMQTITNGWFTPNPGRSLSFTCATSNITRGWEDTYNGIFPDPKSISHSVKPTLHVKVDPDNVGVNAADENKTNNEMWITTQWDAGIARFVPLENIDITAGTTSLVATDSLYYGVYSQNFANGNITINNKTRTYSLTHGNEKLGFQGRRMIVTLTGGITNKYIIKNASKVTAEFLGQNFY